MEHEILKHLKNVYKTMKISNHSIGEKLGEILVEVLIIVFAITLSIWLHSWSEHRQQQAETKEFLSDLKNDLANDTTAMDGEIKSLTKQSKVYSLLRNKSDSQLDTINNISLNLGLNLLKSSTGIYEGFKSSGKIGFIENKKLKRLILEYYQETLPGLYDVQKYKYEKGINLFEAMKSIGKNDNFLTNSSVKSKMNLDDLIAKAVIEGDNEAIKEAKAILAIIDKELSE